MAAEHPLLDGIHVLERGWLSSNNILVHGAAGEGGALLIDSSHVNHAAQTVQLVRHLLSQRGEPLRLLVNTHLHSDHCGGNAALQLAFGMPLWIPPGQADDVRAWHDEALSHVEAGQQCARFAIDGVLTPGESLRAGGRDWQVIASPGHDPHAVMLFHREAGVLVSADALWQDGFGVVFPEVEGEPGFDDVAQVLDLIAALPVKLVIPGHGAPFTDVAEALARARSRLQAFRSDPARHARYASKVFVKYRLMEMRAQAMPELQAWAAGVPLMSALWQRYRPAGISSVADWVDGLVADLVRGGALAVEGDRVLDR